MDFQIALAKQIKLYTVPTELQHKRILVFQQHKIIHKTFTDSKGREERQDTQEKRGSKETVSQQI